MERYNKFFEKTFKLNKAVDYIYNKYYRKDVKKLKEVDKSYERDISNDKVLYSISSRTLPGKEISIANETNPVLIEIGFPYDGNAYDPLNKVITLDIVSTNALNHLYNTYYNYDNYLTAGLSFPEKQRKMFYLEFDESKLKGTIYHELSHWLNDSLHGQNIEKIIKNTKKASELGLDYKSVITQGRGSSFLTDFEIDAQIHAIKQLKRNFKSRWDFINFESMIDLAPSLNLLRKKLSSIDYIEWKKKMKKRMVRENLLGKDMR